MPTREECIKRAAGILARAALRIEQEASDARIAAQSAASPQEVRNGAIPGNISQQLDPRNDADLSC